jgi:protein involved in polysaccharide export with SLBB domain
MPRPLLTLPILLCLGAVACKTPPPPNPEMFFAPRIVDTQDYRLNVGDVIEFVYTIGPQPITSAGGYRINVGDQLRVEFAFTPDFNRDVSVRPDGKVTLPIIGEVDAYGKTATELATELRTLYQPHLRDPLITVDIPKFSSLTESVSQAIITPQGTARTFVYPVRPDGMVTLVAVGDIQAFGRTIKEIDLAISDSYAAIGHPEIQVTPVLQRAGAQQIYVLGEVNQEGIYEMNGDITVLQAIALARGFQDTANRRSVMVVRRMNDGSMQAQRVNVMAAIRSNDFTQNVYLRPYDMVYVPREFISDANVWIEQYVTRGVYALFDRPIDYYISTETAEIGR